MSANSLSEKVPSDIKVLRHFRFPCCWESIVSRAEVLSGETIRVSNYDYSIIYRERGMSHALDEMVTTVMDSAMHASSEMT